MFSSDASNLGAGATGATQIYMRDRAHQLTDVLTRSSTGDISNYGALI